MSNNRKENIGALRQDITDLKAEIARAQHRLTMAVNKIFGRTGAEHTSILSRLDAIEAKLSKPTPSPDLLRVYHNFTAACIQVLKDTYMPIPTIGDLVSHDRWTQCRILAHINRGLFYVKFCGMVSGPYSYVRNATPEERRAYKGTPPFMSGQWCMVRDKETDDWPMLGVREFAALTKNGRWYCVHCPDGTAISSFRFARLLTPKELRDHGKDGAE
jgi:hypothetical protein